MKVYLIENLYGSYDDTTRNIDKIFNTKQKAKDYIANVESRMKNLEIIADSLSTDDFDERDDIYESEIDRFRTDFPDSHWDRWDGNHFSIVEREVE